MKSFDYIRPTTLAEAVAAGAQPGSAYLAGGTNLLDQMKTGAAGPDRVIDITRLPGLDRIEVLEDGGMRIGAMVRNSDLARDPAFARAFPAVAEALLSAASPQLRNAATVGGNVMQSTRCPYFFDPHSACNRREAGSGCAAKGGETRSHAVIGWSDGCIATHPSDFCVPLAALDAEVEIEGAGGKRRVALTDFLLLPGETPERVTALAPGELVTGIRLPAAATAFAGNQRYLKLRERTSFAFAVVSAAAALRLDGGHIVEARLALGGIAARPWRVPAAEALLTGAQPGPDSFLAAAKAALAEARPSGDNAFKIDLAKRIAVRALMLAAAGTPDRMPALPASVFASQNGASVHA